MSARVDRLGAGLPAVSPRTRGQAIQTGCWRYSQIQNTNNNTKTNKGRIARSVRFEIAANKNEEFHTLFRNEILPTPKKQDGFKDEMLLVQDQHVLAISVWNDMDSARASVGLTRAKLVCNARNHPETFSVGDL